MGWFRSTPDPSSQALSPAPFDPAATRIAAGTRIVGRIEGGVEVVLDGELAGDVRLAAALLVGPKGVVKGNLEARVVRIAGKVTGNVHGNERVELLAGGSVEGDLLAPRVVVTEGAFLSGKVVMHEVAADRASGGPGAGDSTSSSLSESAPASAEVAAAPRADGQRPAAESSPRRANRERAAKNPNS